MRMPVCSCRNCKYEYNTTVEMIGNYDVFVILPPLSDPSMNVYFENKKSGRI